MQILIKIYLGLILIYSASFALNQIPNISTLQGDEKASCETILCLSTGQRPSECTPPLRRYFSIHFRKPWKTLAARKSFLSLCPVGDGAAQDKDFLYLRDDVILNLSEDCTVENLNRVELKYDPKSAGFFTNNKYVYRINPNLTKSCQLLISSKYTRLKPVYTCNAKFYDYKSWNRGYALIKITKQEYDAIEDVNMKYRIRNNGIHTFTNAPYLYFRKELIEKNCWIIK